MVSSFSLIVKWKYYGIWKTWKLIWSIICLQVKRKNLWSNALSNILNCSSWQENGSHLKKHRETSNKNKIIKRSYIVILREYPYVIKTVQIYFLKIAIIKKNKLRYPLLLNYIVLKQMHEITCINRTPGGGNVTI